MKKNWMSIKGDSRFHLYAVLAVSVSTSLLLEVARISITGHVAFIFLIWNLFLACIPLSTIVLIKWLPKLFVTHFMFWSAVAFWLLFFPNSPYLITDFVHLHQRTGVPIWFDILLLMSFAWNGLVLGLISLLEIHGLVEARYNRWMAWSFVVMAIFLGGFGIYLGRVLRWNSWDILTNPFDLILNILYIVAHPVQHWKAWGMTTVFAVFLLIAYLTLHLLARSGIGQKPAITVEKHR